ncbi:hypothetical protein TNCV_3152381 [Trichonephila clavipes]|nr:hypothetical protein TNCV_3152381 [Trichonephila clavipes]
MVAIRLALLGCAITISDRESNCNESEESADAIDNIPVNPGIYVARDVTEWIQHNINVRAILATLNAL